MPKSYEMEAYKRAQELYCAGLTLDKICATMKSEGFGGPSKPTLIDWIKEGNWESAKNQALAVSARLSGDALKATLLDALETLKSNLRESPEIKTVTAIAKITELLERLSGKGIDKRGLALEFTAKFTRYMAKAEEHDCLEAVERNYDALIEALAA